MEKLAECSNRGSVRKTMLKHEEMFRHQVHALHRIYKDQIVLMGIAELHSSPSLNHSRTEGGQSSPELKGLDPERSADEHTSNTGYGAKLMEKQILQGSSASWTDDGSQIELTLSIGCGSYKKKQAQCVGCCSSEPELSDAGPTLVSKQDRQVMGEEYGDSSPVFLELLI